MVDTNKNSVAEATSQSDANGDFVLKHRVAGAAFLLFFGALVLPWLLGPPSEASKTPTAALIDQSDGEISAADIEDEILAEIEDNSDIAAEQVYISKITPLDAARVEEERRRAEAQKESKSSAAVLARADVGASEPATSDKSKSSDESDEKKSAQKKTPTETAKKTTQEKPKTKPKPVVKTATEKSTGSSDTPAAKPKTNSREDDLTAALAQESASKRVDVGWVVQVGVFTDKKGADKVVNDLKTKGFKPSTSIVNTNRGDGTRVWLGPFAQRVDAAKTKTRLTDRTGEPGFIRAYP